MPQDETFDPEKMQSLVDRLKAEGRMPTPELLDSVIAETRAEYQKELKRVQAEDRFQAKKRRAKKQS